MTATIPAPEQYYAFAPVQARVVGDRWDLAATFKDGNGALVNLTLYTPVGSFYRSLLPAGNDCLMLTVANGGVQITGLGTALFLITGTRPDGTPGQTTPIRPQDQRSLFFPTRLAIDLVDGLGGPITYLIQPFLPVDPRTAGC